MKRMLAAASLVLFVVPLFAADVADLLKQLKDRDPDMRRTAAKQLSEAGSDAKSAEPMLIQALKDKDLFVRRYAAEALGKIDSDPKKAIPALVLALRDNKKEVQQAAAMSLGRMGANAAPHLALVLDDATKDTDVRAKAAEALGKIGPPAKSAIPALIGALKAGAGKKKGPAPSGDIRLEAATALGEIATANDKNAIMALQELSTAKGNRDRILKQTAASAARSAQARKE